MLAENGEDDFVILEAADRIGGRMRKEDFAGVTVELGAGWIAGVGAGGNQINPVWEMAQHSNLRTCFSDYSNARYNIYDNQFVSFPSLSFSLSLFSRNNFTNLFVPFVLMQWKYISDRSSGGGLRQGGGSGG